MMVDNLRLRGCSFSFSLSTSRRPGSRPLSHQVLPLHVLTKANSQLDHEDSLLYIEDVIRKGIADLPLHRGRAPRWLFSKMKELAREVIVHMVTEFNPQYVLDRLSDPFWFQAFGCLLGFDWHSSGVTTTVCGAMKEGLKELEPEIGIFIAGGKGGRSRRTPGEIEAKSKYISGTPARLVYASRMAAKVDSSGLQDGYQLYHHCFVFTKHGDWCVIQQGMNPHNHFARRYHWLSSELSDFVREPHKAILSDGTGEVLNLVAFEGEKAREVCVEIAKQKPESAVVQLKRVRELTLSPHHHIDLTSLNPERIGKILLKTYEEQPEDFELLLGMPGVGPKTMRALALLSELVYGVAPSFRDPARFSFAHGGKDGHPYPVDIETYSRTIEILKRAVSEAKLGYTDKLKAIKRLEKL